MQEEHGARVARGRYRTQEVTLSASSDRRARREAAQARIARHQQQTFNLLAADDSLSSDTENALTSRFAMAIAADFRAVGGVTPRQARFSQRWMTSLGMPIESLPARTVGTATNRIDDGAMIPLLTPQGGATVRVTDSQGTRIAAASEYRRQRTAGARTTRTATAATEHRTVAADLPPVMAD